MASDRIELESGGLHLTVEARRSGGGDFGVTFRVFGKRSERTVELLRFDCFKNNPHYHFDPAGKGETHVFDRAKNPRPLVWVMDQLQTQLPGLIEHAGYADIARGVDQSVVATDVAKLMPDIVRLHDRALKELAPAP